MLAEVLVARGVIGCRVRPHPVGDGLDVGRAAAGSSAIESDAHRGHDRDDVVAVDPDARDAEAGRTVGDRAHGLHPDGLRDRPLVVLAEEDDRGREARGEDHGLVDVALAGRAIAEVGDGDRIDAILLRAHGPAGRVKGLRTDDDRGCRHVDRERVPARVGRAAPDLGHVFEPHTTQVGDAVLAVAGEGEVVLAQHSRRADLRGLLAERRWPQPELALALQRGRLVVETAHHDHGFVDVEQVFAGEVVHPGVVFGRFDPHALRRQKLDRLIDRRRNSWCRVFGKASTH